MIVGHVPLTLSQTFHLFLKHGGKISVQVTGTRRNKGIGCWGLRNSETPSNLFPSVPRSRRNFCNFIRVDLPACGLANIKFSLQVGFLLFVGNGRAFFVSFSAQPSRLWPWFELLTELENCSEGRRAMPSLRRVAYCCLARSIRVCLSGDMEQASNDR